MTQEKGPLLIWGFHPVREFVQRMPESVIEVVHLPTFGQKKRQRSLISLIEHHHIRMRTLSGLSSMGVPPGATHQGICALVKNTWEFSELEFFDVLKNGRAELVVALDEITDPQNFGAIIRGAVAMGVGFVVAQKRASCPVTGAVVKASSGAIAAARICYCRNLISLLKEVKGLGIDIVGLTPWANTPIWEADLQGKVVLVLGSEEKGIRKNVRRLCNITCSIPLEGGIESLNVSQASGIVLYEALRQRSM